MEGLSFFFCSALSTYTTFSNYPSTSPSLPTPFLTIITPRICTHLRNITTHGYSTLISTSIPSPFSSRLNSNDIIFFSFLACIVHTSPHFCTNEQARVFSSLLFSSLFFFLPSCRYRLYIIIHSSISSCFWPKYVFCSLWFCLVGFCMRLFTLLRSGGSCYCRLIKYKSYSG